MGVLIRPRPSPIHGRRRGPRRGRELPPPPWGGRGRRQLHVCKAISWSCGSKPPPSCRRFSTPPGRVPRWLAAWGVPAPNAGSIATAREFGEPRPARGGSAEAQGLFPRASPPPAAPPARPVLPPPPESITTAGPRLPAPSWSVPTAPADKFAGRNKTLGRLLPSPGVVSAESRGPGLARPLTPALDQLRPPRVQQPRRPHSGRRPLPSPRGAAGPGFSQCIKSFSLQ